MTFKCPDCQVDYGDNEHTPWYCEKTGRLITSEEALKYNGFTRETYSKFYKERNKNKQ